MKKVTGIVTAAIVLGTMFGTAAPAFAASSSTTNTTPTTNSTDTSTTNSVYSSNTATASTTDPTSISPDSCLYFVTQVTEAINVALALNDLQKAQLLAQYGEAQVAKANALLQSGPADVTNQLLTQAAADQTLAAVADTSAFQDGQASPAAVSATKESITANVTALANALQHVGNAKAQASLEKNIEKAFARMQKHLKKEAVHESKTDTANTATQSTATQATSTQLTNTQATIAESSSTPSTSSEKQDDQSRNEHDNNTDQNQSINTKVTASTSITSHQGEDWGHGKSESHGGDHHGNH